MKKVWLSIIMMVVLGGAQMTYAAAKTSVTDSKPYAVYVELSTPKYGFFKPEKVRYEVVLKDKQGQNVLDKKVIEVGNFSDSPTDNRYRFYGVSSENTQLIWDKVSKMTINARRTRDNSILLSIDYALNKVKSTACDYFVQLNPDEGYIEYLMSKK